MRTDLLADSLTMVRNASMVKKEKVDIIKSRMNLAVMEILKNEGYVANLKVLDGQTPKMIRVYLKYNSNGKPAIRGLKKISKPSLQFYVGHKRIPRVLNGLGRAIITTSKGLVTDKEAKQNKIGGKLLVFVW